MVGIRIPLNATFAAEIQLHNPYPSVLRITEMFASDGDVHLELPAQQFSKVEDTTIWVRSLKMPWVFGLWSCAKMFDHTEVTFRS